MLYVFKRILWLHMKSYLIITAKSTLAYIRRELTRLSGSRMCAVRGENVM